ncbi:MAG: LysR family transcriptional regulator, partial [Proteobacteria bacterium]|nr:LysR family transcriptional regulator [Pseudomonadota bacterium]
MDITGRIQIFVSVVKHQSFAEAARSLGITTSAVSKQVQTLEDSLGVKLLHRTTRRLNLTEEGALYFERVSRIVEDLEEAERLVQNTKAHPTGVLKVNAPITFATYHLAKPLADFAKACPDIEMQIDLSDRYVDLIEEGYDVAIRIGILQDSSLIARKLAPCHIPLYASPEYLKKHGTPKTPADLKDHTFIGYTMQQKKDDEWQYKAPDGKIGKVPITTRINSNNGEMMLAAACAGLGIIKLPSFMIANEVKSGRLKPVLPGYEIHPERNIYAVFPENRYLSNKVRTFVNFLSDTFKGTPEWDKVKA